jgi:hypothetical protein
LQAADTETAPSLLWFAAIQGIESKQDPTDLAPKSCFVSAEAIQREVGQIGETQKATRKVGVGFNGRFRRFRRRIGPGFCSIGDAVRSWIETGRVGRRNSARTTS